MTDFVAPPKSIDVFLCCRTERVFEGIAKLSQFPRLAQEVSIFAEPETLNLHWQVNANQQILNQQRYATLRLKIRTTLKLECQRCMEMLEWPVVIECERVLVKQTSDLEKAEVHLSEFDQFEILLANHHFNLLELIEDEVLLSIPFAPKHSVCP